MRTLKDNPHISVFVAAIAKLERNIATSDKCFYTHTLYKISENISIVFTKLFLKYEIYLNLLKKGIRKPPLELTKGGYISVRE